MLIDNSDNIITESKRKTAHFRGNSVLKCLISEMEILSSVSLSFFRLISGKELIFSSQYKTPTISSYYTLAFNPTANFDLVSWNLFVSILIICYLNCFYQKVT